jgi:hypothetical protein
VDRRRGGLRQLWADWTDGEVRVFDHAPGVVARCSVCDQVLLRLVRGPGRGWLDLRGLTYLQFPAPDQT